MGDRRGEGERRERIVKGVGRGRRAAPGQGAPLEALDVEHNELLWPRLVARQSVRL